MFEHGVWMAQSAMAALMPDTRELTVESLLEKYRTPTSHFINIQGQQLHYTDVGQGPVLLCLHGIYGASQDFAPLSAELQKDYRIISVDLPNFGLSAGYTGRWHKHLISALLCNLLDALQIEQCAVLGNSLGGYFAYRFCADYPARISHLVLCGSAGFWFTPPLALLSFAAGSAGIAALRSNLPRSLMDHLVSLAVYDKTLATTALLDRFYELSLCTGHRVGMAGMLRFISQHVATDNACLATIKQPVLVLWGQEDEWIPVQHSEQFAAAMPQSEVHILQACGHMPMYEKPEQCAALLRDFYFLEQ
jgi:pimeloyl-ACP methyl ester carboxylesterase